MLHNLCILAVCTGIVDPCSNMSGHQSFCPEALKLVSGKEGFDLADIFRIVSACYHDSKHVLHNLAVWMMSVKDPKLWKQQTFHPM
jgi:hypothetical protein